jgi:hypothetical protein
LGYRQHDGRKVFPASLLRSAGVAVSAPPGGGEVGVGQGRAKRHPPRRRVGSGSGEVYGGRAIAQFCEHYHGELNHQRGLSMHVVFMLIPMFYRQSERKAHHAEILRELARRVEAGEMRPLVHEEKFAFEDVGKAHAFLESGGAIGNVVLRA